MISGSRTKSGTEEKTGDRREPQTPPIPLALDGARLRGVLSQGSQTPFRRHQRRESHGSRHRSHPDETLMTPIGTLRAPLRPLFRVLAAPGFHGQGDGEGFAVFGAAGGARRLFAGQFHDFRQLVMGGARLARADIGVQLHKRVGQRVVGADDEIGLVIGEVGQAIVFAGIGFGSERGGGHGRAPWRGGANQSAALSSRLANSGAGAPAELTQALSERAAGAASQSP